MSWKNYCDTGVIVLGAVACWAFFQFWYPYHFFYQEQNQIFLWSGDYISTYFDRPGGLARLIGDFLTQFYYYLFAGAAILAGCILAIGLLFYRICRILWDFWDIRDSRIKRGIGLGLSLAAMGLVAVFHFSTSYRLSSTVSILGWMITGTVLLISRFANEIRRTVPMIWWRWFPVWLSMLKAIAWAGAADTTTAFWPVVRIFIRLVSVLTSRSCRKCLLMPSTSLSMKSFS